MKIQAYEAEFTQVQSGRDGEEARYKSLGKVLLIVDEDNFEGSLASLAYRRANREQLDCSKVDIRRV